MEEELTFDEIKSRHNPLDKYRNWLFLAFVLLLLAGVLCYVFLSATEQGGLYINEVMLSNDTTLSVDALGSPDWVELYNGTDHDINLEGYGLSDHAKTVYQFTFPNVTIEAGGYLVIYFAGDADNTSQELLCTGTSLSRTGETLYLADANNTILDLKEIPALQTDVSYARRDDGTFGYCYLATPGSKNATKISDEPNN